MVRNLWQDIRYGVRTCVKNPGFTALVVLTLALGIGATTAIFSIIDAVLLRPLPYKDSDRLAMVLDSKAGNTGSSRLFAAFADYQGSHDHTETLEQIEACTWATGSQTLKWRETTERVLAIPVTAGFFSILGAHAARGRTFEPDDLNRGPVVVLSHRFWRGRLGAPPDLPGAGLILDGQESTVLGVMDESFDFYPKQADLWVLIRPDSRFYRDPLNSLVVMVARMKRGVGPERAQEELGGLHRRIADSFPSGNWLSEVEPVVL